MKLVVQMQIIVVMDGKDNNFPLIVKPSDTIMDVKKQIFDKRGTPVHLQRLAINFVLLEDTHTFAYYCIQENSRIRCIVRPEPKTTQARALGLGK
jgi:hypothetical protein